MKKFNWKLLIPILFIGVSLWALYLGREGWGWVLFLAFVSFVSMDDN